MSETATAVLEALWQLVPQNHDVWAHVEPGRHAQARWREVVELVCGSLWHLERAAQVGRFDAEQYEELRNIDMRPWETWQASRTAQPGETDGGTNLVTTNIQSMLLADAILRLAGAWQILEDMGKVNMSPTAKRLGKLRNAVAEDGSLKPGTNEDIRGLLVLHAVRDTLMHGELSPDRRNAQHRHRDTLYASGTYGPTALFEHCVKASELMLRMFHAEYSAAALYLPPEGR